MSVALDQQLTGRWVASLAVVLALHGAGLLLLRDLPPVESPVTPADAIQLDLAPMAPPQPPAPAPAPVPDTPPPQQASTAPPPQPATPVPELTPPPEAARPLPLLRQPPPPRRPALPRRPASQPHHVVPEPTTTGPPPAPSAAAPVAAAPATPGPEAATWPSRLAAHLLRFRHYPADAERRGLTGVAILRFSVDPSGRVVSSSLVSGSGHEILDQEAHEWLRRAEPLPPPPPDKAAPAQIVVPFSFVLPAGSPP